MNSLEKDYNILCNKSDADLLALGQSDFLQRDMASAIEEYVLCVLFFERKYQIEAANRLAELRFFCSSIPGKFNFLRRFCALSKSHLAISEA